jgi:peptidyl-prolyl cis-trans isomerase B (cyclophilin B)
LALVLAAASPTSVPSVTILQLERDRSLGDGALAQLLNGSDQAVVTRAALAIGRTKQPGGEVLLAAHLRDVRVPVRAMAIYGLGLIGLSDRWLEIYIALVTDRSSAVRAAALDALARFEAGGTLPAAAEPSVAWAIGMRLKRDPDPTVRARAAWALVEFRNGGQGNFASLQLVGALARERNENVRCHIAWTIFRGYAIRVPRELLVRLSRDRNEVVRIEAARALARVKNRDAIPALQPLLSDPSWRVQEQAAEAIRALEGKPATDHWKAIPPNVHVPAAQPDALAGLPALPRTTEGHPSAPTVGDVGAVLPILPRTAADMDGPVRGPHPRVRIVTTKGNLYVTLYPEWAPLTVANFLRVADRGYYDNNRWFRIVPDFVVQTGDPNDNGEGDAGYTIGAEENPLEQRSYVISMGMNYDDKTNMPIRDSAGTQFYITLSPQLHLNRDFTVFGEVSGGFDVLGRLIESDRMLRVERIPDASI